MTLHYSKQVKITDTQFDGVEVRVYEPSATKEKKLRRSVVYIHGGGWALSSTSTCLYLMTATLYLFLFSFPTFIMCPWELMSSESLTEIDQYRCNRQEEILPHSMHLSMEFTATGCGGG